MNGEPFLQPRLIGTRFENHAIPLEFLKDLAVIEEMMIEVAKWKFLKDNPSRQRVPRGFLKGIELKLTGVEEGSARPMIFLFMVSSLLFPPDEKVYLDRARDSVISAIDAANRNAPITEFLPHKSLGYFDRIGRSLRNGEVIEFETPIHTTPVRFDRTTRRKLIMSSEKIREISEETLIRGMVPEADRDDMTFEILMADGRKIPAPITDQHEETIVEAFKDYRKGVRLLVQGVARLSLFEKILRFESIEHVNLLDPLDVPSRIDELRELRVGWLEGKGEVPSQEGLDWFSQVFDQRYLPDLPLPHIYPTAEGGIQAEWSIGSNEVTLDVDLEHRVGEWHCLNMDTNEETSHQLNLDQEKDWQRLNKDIQSLEGQMV